MSDMRASIHGVPAGGRIAGFRPHGVSRRNDAVAGELAEAADESHNRFKIRMARSPAGSTRASSLVERRYAWRGYSTSAIDPDAIGRMTFAACVADETVATITAGLDS